jgi:hypothetical protein
VGPATSIYRRIPPQTGKHRPCAPRKPGEAHAPKADWLHAGGPLGSARLQDAVDLALGRTSTTFSDISSTDTPDTTRHDTTRHDKDNIERQPRAQQRKNRDFNRKRNCRMETPVFGGLLQLFGAIETSC